MAGKHEKYQRLLDYCKTLPPTPTAVAHPCDDSSLEGAVGAAQMGLIAPILVGPRARIEAVAKERGLNLAGLPMEETEHSHESAAQAVEDVRVAVLSAVETVNPKIPSTVEAAALCKMADRKQITGAILDGPLALDNAISLESVAIKNIDSPVAGRANVLAVPDLEAGNMLAKSLTFLAGADAAGIVLGARVPIILTSRADSLIARLASCAVAALVANARRANAANAVVWSGNRVSDAI